MKAIYSCTGAMLAILVCGALFWPHVMTAGPGTSTTVNSAPAPVASPTQEMHLADNYGKLPLSFEANQGQTDSRVKFLSRGRGYSLFLTGDEAVLTLGRASQKAKGKSQNAKVKAGAAPPAIDKLTTDLGPRTTDSILRMKLVGANVNAALSGIEELPGKSNYFIGNDPKKWRTNVANYARVKYAGVYPGVDLAYYGNQGGQLEYDFVLAPGADPGAIALEVTASLSRHISSKNGGVKPPPQERAHRDAPLHIAGDGDLVVKTDGGGEIRFHKPVVYQESGVRSQANYGALSNLNFENRQSSIDNRQFLDGRYVLQANNQVGFKVPTYDHTRPLVIDPVLSYSTYLGGSLPDAGNAIAADSSGNAYVTGFTASADFPTTPGAFQALCAGTCVSFGDVFVTKMNPSGSALVYSTFLGGSSNDVGYAIALDSSGNAYVTGETDSFDFPTVNPLQPTNNNSFATAFVSKLNAAGSALVYSTYLGGNNDDRGLGIAVDPSSNAVVVGFTESADFPMVNAVQTTYNSATEAFVAKLNAAGTALVYSTYLGGAAYSGFSGPYNSAQGAAVDASGSAYVTGWTTTTDFPTVNPFQATNPTGGTDYSAFVTKLNAVGSALVYSTYLGGSNYNQAYAIAVDASGNAYVTGATYSTDFPTVNPLQAANHGSQTAFVTKLNAAGSALIYSTYLGGSAVDAATGIAVDASGNAFLTGYTESGDFPTVNPLQAGLGGSKATNAFVTELNAAGSAIVYSTYLGGSSQDFAYGIAVDASDNAYVTGSTSSTDIPTVNPLQATNRATPPPAASAAFVAKVGAANSPGIAFGPGTLSFPAAGVGTPVSQTLTVTAAGSVPLILTDIALGGPNSADYAQTNTCGALPTTLAAGGQCIVTVIFTAEATGTRTANLTFTDNAASNSQTVNLTGTGGGPPTLVITASSASMTYGGAVPTITASYVGFVNGDTAASLTTLPTCTTTAASSSPVGSYPSTCSGAVDANYTIRYTAGTVTITPVPLTITASSASMTYGGAVPTITASYGGFVRGDTAASLTAPPTCTTTATSSSPVGSYPSTCSGAVDANYTISYAAGTITVGKAPLTITASSASITSGGTVPTITPSYVGFVNGDTAASLTTAPTCTTTATSSSPVGSYPSACSGAVDANYTFSYTAGTVTVGKTPLTIMASSASMTYGGAVPTITASYVGFVNGDTAASLTTLPTCSTTATSSSPVGSYPSTCSGAVDANYTISYTAGTVTVGKAPLTITAPSPTISAGSSIPTFTPTFNGFVNGQTAGSLTTPPTCTTTATTSSPVGVYPITCSGAVDANYNISYVAGTLTITASAGGSLSPTVLAFGTWAENNTATPQKITLTNISTTPLTFSGITFTGANPGDFSQANTCSSTLVPGTSCYIRVSFTPSTLGAESATLNVFDSAANSPQTVALSGAGSAPVVLFPNPANLGTVAVHTPSQKVTLTLANAQSVALSISSTVISNSDFAETSTTCGASLAPHTLCTISVIFTPSIVGTETATLTINDSAIGSPQTATLTGAGK